MNNRHMGGRRLCLHALIEAIEIAEMGGIRLDANGLRSNSRNGSVELGLAAAGYEDPSAFRCETLGSSEADTGGAAGHDGYFSFESAYHDLLYGRLPMCKGSWV